MVARKRGWLARDGVRSPAPRAAPPIVAPKSYNRRWPRSAVICSRCCRKRVCCRRYSFRSTPAAFTVAAHRGCRCCALHSPTSFNRCARRRLHRPPLLIGSTLAASTVLCSAFAASALRVCRGCAPRCLGRARRRLRLPSLRSVFASQADPCYVDRKERQPPLTALVSRLV